MTPRRPTLSAVVMGYRNDATIERSVCSVLEQDSDDPFEVVVVVSGPDRSAEIVRERFPDIPLVESPARLTPGGARNAGTRRARGDIVAFLAADCLASPEWVRGRIAAHRGGHDVVAGAVGVDAPRTAAALAGLYLLFSARLVGHRPGPAADPQAYSLSFTRSALDAAGPFREDVRLGEDTLMMRQLRALGIGVWFEPSISIAHLGPSTLGALLRDQFHRGRRQSGWDIATGPFPRRGWESVPVLGSPVGAASLRASKRFVARWSHVIPNVWRATRGRRSDLVVALPAMALGSVAYQAGWIADQVRSRSVDAKRGEGTPWSSAD